MLSTRSMCGLLLAATLIATPAPRAHSDEPEAISGKRPLSLRECVQLALRGNPSLRAANEDRAAAHARTQQARSPLLPQVRGSGTASKSHSDASTAFFPGGVPATDPESESDRLNANLSVDQSIVNLSDWRSASSAKASEFAAEELYRGAQEAIVAQVERTYFNSLKSIRLQEVSEENLKVGEEQLKLAEKRREVGIGVEADILKARAQNAQDRLALINAKKEVQIARTALSHVIGIALDAPLVIDDLSPDAAVAAPPLPDLSTALAARPDIREQQHRLRAAERSLGAAQLRYVPDLGFGFQYGRLLDASRTTINDSTGAESTTEFEATSDWQATLSLSLAIFDGGAREGRIKEARAGLRATRHTFDQLLRNAELEIETASLNASAAAEAIDVSRDGMRAAEEDLRVTQGSYTQGLLPILNLVTAQAALVTARTAYVSATYDFRIALAELDRALGRGVSKYTE